MQCTSRMQLTHLACSVGPVEVAHLPAADKVCKEEVTTQHAPAAGAPRRRELAGRLEGERAGAAPLPRPVRLHILRPLAGIGRVWGPRARQPAEGALLLGEALDEQRRERAAVVLLVARGEGGHAVGRVLVVRDVHGDRLQPAVGLAQVRREEELRVAKAQQVHHAPPRPRARHAVVRRQDRTARASPRARPA
eukprot:7377114-Prymnesium_polylepis.1